MSWPFQAFEFQGDVHFVTRFFFEFKRPIIKAPIHMKTASSNMDHIRDGKQHWQAFPDAGCLTQKKTPADMWYTWTPSRVAPVDQRDANRGASEKLCIVIHQQSTSYIEIWEFQTPSFTIHWILENLYWSWQSTVPFFKFVSWKSWNPSNPNDTCCEPTTPKLQVKGKERTHTHISFCQHRLTHENNHPWDKRYIYLLIDWSHKNQPFISFMDR